MKETSDLSNLSFQHDVTAEASQHVKVSLQSDLHIRIRSGTRFRKNSGRYSYIKVLV
jgi:hypothetical protein